MSGKRAEVQAAEESREDVELRLAKAMAHPVRVKALALMNERPIAPVEVAEAIGVELSNVSYHFRTLLELDCIEATATEQVRGSIKTTYKSKVRLMFDHIVWAGLGREEKSGLSTEGVKALMSRTLDAFEARTFDAKENRHLSVSTVLIDWEGLDEIAVMLDATLNRVAEIQAEAAERAGERDERFPVTVGLLGFESPRLYETNDAPEK
jgi:DNA-binding transcriptional ArsR family regulator